MASCDSNSACDLFSFRIVAVLQTGASMVILFLVFSLRLEFTVSYLFGR